MADGEASGPAVVESRPPASLLNVPIQRSRAPKATQSGRGTGAVTDFRTEKADWSPAACPEAASDELDVATARETAPPPVPSDLLTYWRRLARAGIADASALDAATIGRRWPYTLLLRGEAETPLDIARVYRPIAGDEAGSAQFSGHPLAGDLCSQVSSWALALAREAVLSRHPEISLERFALADHACVYRALALPCAWPGDYRAYVLLYLHSTTRSVP